MSMAQARVWALVLFGLNLLLLTIVCVEPAMLNNGDYFRVTKGFFSDKAWLGVPECSHLNTHLTVFRSSMGGVFLAAAYMASALGVLCFYHKVMTLVLALIFCLGVFCAFKQSRSNAPVLFGTTTIALLFSFFMSSYYEEAILLPLMPWLIFGWRRFSETGRFEVFLFVAVLVLFSKAQMIVFLPLLSYVYLCGWLDFKQGAMHKAAGLSMLLAAALAAILLKSNNAEANAYNRYFNGIGWATQNVADWPQRNFPTRSKYFYSNQASLQSRPLELFSGIGVNLMGTSYWPTANAMLMSDGREKFIRSAADGLKASTYIGALSKPTVAFAYIKSVAEVTAQSDYSLEYIRAQQGANIFSKFSEMRDASLSNGGWLFVFSMLIITVLAHGCGMWVALTYLVGLPLVVVAGDGFYEFEKHFATYAMCIPIVSLLFLIPPRHGRAPYPGA